MAQKSRVREPIEELGLLSIIHSQTQAALRMRIASQGEASGRTVCYLWALMCLYLLEAPRVLSAISVNKVSHLRSFWLLLYSFSQRRCI